jgi:hypothetical protein
MILVDELRTYPNGPRGMRHWCHLTDSEDDVDRLHAFAARLGLKRAWFQAGSRPHYDLTAGRRREALRLGAFFVLAKHQARDTLARRRMSGLATA